MFRAVPWHKETLDLLKKTKISDDVLASKIGVTPRWIYDLKRKKYKNPGITTVYKLNKILKDEQNGQR